MPNNLKITELDFDSIKNQLIEYFSRTDSPFKDWDFTGSGLSHLLDVLAYNTTMNAMLAHSTANEAFLDSAQLRKNVVGRAKTLGYLPSSMSAARTYITLTGSDIASLTTVAKGTTFSTSVGGESFNFVTLSDFTGDFGPTASQREEILAYQGSVKTISSTFDASAERQKFIIPDTNIDISTLRVTTFPHSDTSSVTSYTQFVQLSNVTPTSQIYYISENSNGFYEIEFGDDVLGVKPQAGSVVQMEYLVTNGPSANGAVIFTLDSDLGFSEIEVDTATTSSIGGNRETIEEIRFNAPLSFTAQDRAVTADDYKSIILNQLESVNAVSVWGGEDNDPVDLGSVYISAKKPGDVNNTLSDDEKAQIIEVLEDKGVLTLTHKFADPEYIYLYFNLQSKFNPNLTSLDTNSMEASILKTIENFDNANLEDYNSVFRYSQFLAAIDNSSLAILNTSARLHAYKKFDYTTTTTEKLIDFTFELDDEEVDLVFTKSSGSFNIGGVEHYFGTVYKGNLEYWVVIWKYDGDNRSYYPEYGSSPATYYGIVNRESGICLLGDVSSPDFGSLSIVDSQYPTSSLPVIDSNVLDMKVHSRPSSNDVVAKRNSIVDIDEAESVIDAEVDLISLGGNSAVKSYKTFNRDA